MPLSRTIFFALVCSFFVNGQTESFKLTFDHQALPVKQLQKTGDFYLEILSFEEIEATASQNPPKRWIINHEGKQLHLIPSDDGAPNSIVNHMAFSTTNLDKVVEHLQKNKVDYWTDEGKKKKCEFEKKK